MKYIEAMPCTGNEYAIGHTHDDDNNLIPWLFHSYEEAQAEIIYEQNRYKTEIQNGQRDPDDNEYDGIIFVCELTDDTIILYDPDTMTEVHRGNWKKMVGIE